MARPIHGAGFFGTSVYIRTVISNRLLLSEIKYYFHNRQTRQYGNQPVNALSRNRFIGLDLGERVPGNQQVRGPERRANGDYLSCEPSERFSCLRKIFLLFIISDCLSDYLSVTYLCVHFLCATPRIQVVRYEFCTETQERHQIMCTAAMARVRHIWDGCPLPGDS